MPAANTQAFMVRTIGFICFFMNGVCFWPAKTEAIAARISNIAPVKAPNNKYCSMYKTREIKFNNIICGRLFCW